MSSHHVAPTDSEVEVADEGTTASAPPSSTRKPQRPRGASLRRGEGRKKSKYSAEERAKVQEVRKQRACLRCKVLKIQVNTSSTCTGPGLTSQQCSKENPCTPCLSSAAKGFERKVLSFCYCVRTRYVDVNIFGEPSAEVDGPLEATTALVSRVSSLHTSTSDDDSGETSFEDLIVRWLTDVTFTLPNGSVVGALCSRIRPSEAIDDEFVGDFRNFLFSTSAAHARWHCRGLSTEDFCKVAHACGSRIIPRLDKMLSPQFLAKCSQETIRTLLLILLGSILAVSYTAHQTSSPAFPHELLSSQFHESPTLWIAMREHLCQMLAHHLIFLGSLVGIRLETGSEQSIIDSAIKRWGKTEVNVWGEVQARFSDPTSTATIGGLGAEAQVRQAEAPLVTVACPDLAELPPLGDNPESYLSMDDDNFNFGAEDPTYASDIAVSAQNSPAFPPKVSLFGQEQADYSAIPSTRGPAPVRTFKRRSMWVVQPVDGGPEGIVNVHAPFRAAAGRGIGFFV